MTKTARDVMTPDPACCSPHTTLDEVAKLMARNDCGEIPVIDTGDQIVGVVTDRDIVCRVVAEGKNPLAYTAETCMSGPVITVRVDAPLDDVMAMMEKHQIRRVPVVTSATRVSGSSRRRTYPGWARRARSPSWCVRSRATQAATRGKRRYLLRNGARGGGQRQPEADCGSRPVSGGRRKGSAH